MIRAVIWDVDGTLLDSADQHFAAWAAYAAAVGRPFTRADFAHTFGWRNPEIIRHLFDPAADDVACAEAGLRKETRYRESVRRDGVRLLRGVPELLAGFAARGWPQAVGSSAPRGNLDLLLAVTDTAKFFAAVVSGDDVTRGKPDPEVFLTAAARLGVPPAECLVLEDAPVGVRAAKSAGMTCWAVESHHPADALRQAGADRVVPTWVGLLEGAGLPAVGVEDRPL
jgi:beta-phosphoglucomutase